MNAGETTVDRYRENDGRLGPVWRAGRADRAPLGTESGPGVRFLAPIKELFLTGNFSLRALARKIYRPVSVVL